MILLDLDRPEALKDGLSVVSAYHHLDEKLAFVTRLQYLSLAGRLGAEEIGQIFSVMPEALMPAVMRDHYIWALDYLHELQESIKGKRYLIGDFN